MSDRLQELLRQKALLKEQSDWIDGQIEAERALMASEQPVPKAVSEQPVPAAITTLEPPPAPSSASLEPEAIYQQYGNDPQAAGASARRGCFIAFFAVMLILAACVGAIYLFYSRR